MEPRTTVLGICENNLNNHYFVLHTYTQEVAEIGKIFKNNFQSYHSSIWQIEKLEKMAQIIIGVTKLIVNRLHCSDKLLKII